MPDGKPLPNPMSERRYRLLLAGLAIVAVGALVIGVLSTSGGDGAADRDQQSDAVERFIPRAGDEVLRQAELGIDLAPGYDGTILVNGVEIPTDEQRRVPEQNQVFFTPREDATVEQLEAGPNCAMAVVWRAIDGRGSANDQTFTWCFEAT